MHDTDYAYKATTAEELERLEAMMVNGIRDGGLGFGFGITYSPGASREEIFRLFEIAKREDVPIYVHVRGENCEKPNASVRIPGVISSAPATRIMTPSASEPAGNSPRSIRSSARVKTEKPCRRARYAPTMPVRTINASVGHVPR